MADQKAPKAAEDQVPAELEKSADELVEFLRDPRNKSTLMDFLKEAYTRMEAERVAQIKARVEHEKQVDSARIRDFHQPGNITPLVDENLSMQETERAFARGISLTKKNLVRSVEDRVEEINRLLAGIGGFSSQLKSCFARSTVVFLEQEDPKHSFRERLVFSINLPNYELKKPMEGPRDVKAEPTLGGRSPAQASWDDAVNALAKIIESSGLKPKYCKNDRHYGHFVMKQDLRSNSNLPDEYFSLTLDYNTKERIQEMCKSYNKIVATYEKKVTKMQKSVSRYPADTQTPSYQRKRRSLMALIQERDFFIGSVPDPNNLDEGLLFLIEVSTHKDYHIVKDRMQSIMTKFILHLSQIAEKEAEIDPDLEYELWKSGQVTGSGRHAQGSDRELSQEEIEGLQEYVVDEAAITPINKKKAA